MYVCMYNASLTHSDALALMEPKPQDAELLKACRYAEAKAAIDIIDTRGANFDAIDEFSNTPLHYAALTGLVDVTQWLLDHGAHKSLHIRNNMGATPLDAARIFGPYPAIEAMLGAAMITTITPLRPA